MKKRLASIELTEFLSYLFVFWAITPYFNKRYVYVIPILCLWVLFVCIRKIRLSKNSRMIMTGVVFWALYELVLWLLGISNCGIGVLARDYCFWMSLVIFVIYYNEGRVAHLQRLANFSLFCVVLSAIDNIIINYRYPTLKDNVTILDSYGETFHINIAFTSFAYAMVLCLIYLIYRYLKEKKKRYVLYMIPILILHVQMGRAIPTLALLFSLVYIYGVYMLSSRERGTWAWHMILLFSAGVIGVIFVAALYTDPAIIFKLSPSRSVADKIYMFLTSDRGSGHQRIELAMLSVSTWLSSLKTFLFGIGADAPIFVGGDLSDAYRVGIGNHSYLFDSLGWYGLFGMVVMVSIVWRFYREVFAGLKSDIRRMAILVELLLIILDLFSSLYSPDCGVMLFIFIPATLMRYKEESVYGSISKRNA